MSAICDIKKYVKANAACLEQLKAALLGGEAVSVALLCEKIDEQSELIQDLICDPDFVPPDCLAAPASETEMVVEGNQTANYQEGDTFTVYDDQGNSIGTADVVSSVFNAETNQTTVAYTNLQSTTETAVAVASVKAVKKRVAVEEVVKREAA